MTRIKEEESYEEAKDYSLKERASADSVTSMKDAIDFASNFSINSIKSEFEREQDNISGECCSITLLIFSKNTKMFNIF